MRNLTARQRGLLLRLLMSSVRDPAAFPDSAVVSTKSGDALSWTVAEGVIGGSDGNRLPTDSATRTQAAAILMRCIENAIR